MGTRSYIIGHSLGFFVGIYCHWDGYLEHNGKILFENYKNGFSVAGLIKRNGYISALGKTINECDFKGDEPQLMTEKIEDHIQEADSLGCEFIYCFDVHTRKWTYCERGAQFFGSSDGSEFSEWRDLKETLETLNIGEGSHA